MGHAVWLPEQSRASLVTNRVGRGKISLVATEITRAPLRRREESGQVDTKSVEGCGILSNTFRIDGVLFLGE